MNILMITRLQKKYTKKHLAERVGISPAYYSYIESGERTADIITAKKIADTLELSVEDIFLPTRFTICEVNKGDNGNE